MTQQAKTEKPLPPRWAILVIWEDGEEEYLKEGTSDIPARLSSREAAIEQSKFMEIGMDDDEYQSINVVPYPIRNAAEEHK